MAGTDRKRPSVTGGPAIILVHPQLGENIGTASRAMLNCGLTELRLVAPRDGWPNPKAHAAASGADTVLENARLFDTIEAAIADLQHVYVTTARDRGMVKRIVTPRQAAGELRDHLGEGRTCGVLFGPERMGMLTKDVANADTIVSIPLNPAFSSLNLAQAVLVVGYEWFTAGDPTPSEVLPTGKSRPATKDEYIAFFEHFEEALDESGFFHTEEKRPSMVRNLRNLFTRAQCTLQELRTLHGVVTAFLGARERPKRLEEAGVAQLTKGSRVRK